MVLFIDDEPRFISPFIDAFHFSGFSVQVLTDVDSAWDIIKARTDEIDAIILDIMMPPGRLLEGYETKEGLRTGLLFLELMKDLDERIPVVCLTNADTRLFPKIAHRNHFIFEKKDIDPWQMVEKMSDIKRRKKYD